MKTLKEFLGEANLNPTGQMAKAEKIVINRLAKLLKDMPTHLMNPAQKKDWLKQELELAAKNVYQGSVIDKVLKGMKL